MDDTAAVAAVKAELSVTDFLAQGIIEREYGFRDK